jgi:hypothetical protein
VPVTIRNVSIKNAAVGIKIGPGGVTSSEVSIENASFDNVQTPYDVNHRGTLRVTGSRVTNDPKNRESTRSKVSSGWRKVSCPPLPVFCSSCKTVFPSKNYVFGGAYFHSWNNTESCPHCGAPDAKLSEGLFDLTSEVARILSAPDITYAMMRALVETADEVSLGKVTPDEAISKFRLISPRIGELMTKARKYGPAAVVLISLAIAAAGAYYGMRSANMAEESLSLQRQAMNSDPAGASLKVLEEILSVLSPLEIHGEVSQGPDNQITAEPVGGQGEMESAHVAPVRP